MSRLKRRCSHRNPLPSPSPSAYAREDAIGPRMDPVNLDREYPTSQLGRIIRGKEPVPSIVDTNGFILKDRAVLETALLIQWSRKYR